MKKKKTIKNMVFQIPVFLILIVLALLVLIPVIWMIFSAFKPEKEIISWRTVEISWRKWIKKEKKRKKL